MVSASDVTVVIPVDEAHVYVAERAVNSVKGTGARTKLNIDNRHYGVCVARNEAIRQAETALILPLDADDYLLPGAVERMAQAWQPGKVVYGNWMEIEPMVVEFNSGHPHTIMAEAVKVAPPPAMLPRKHVSHATYLFAKEDWQRVGGYDPDFNIGAEDWAFMIALVHAGCELVRLDGDPLYVKTLSEDGRTHKAIRHKHMIQELLREKYPEVFRTR